MKGFAQVLGTGTPDLTPSILLFFENFRFLFNCGEGMQRLAAQSSISLHKFNGTFLTKLSWDNIGGLPGMLLSISETCPYVRIFGPRNTIQMLSSMKPFLYRPDLHVCVTELLHGQEITVSDFLTVKPLELFPINKPPRSQTNIAPYKKILGTMFNLVDNHDFTPIEVANRKKGKLAPLSSESLDYHPTFLDQQKIEPCSISYYDPLSLCFIIRPPKPNRKYLREISDKLGVPLTKRGEFRLGHSVTLSDGTVIHPDQVLGPEMDQLVCIYMDIPSDEYLDSLFSRCSSEFSRFQNDSREETVSFIFHQIDRSVASNSNYQLWMRSFGPTTKHIIMLEDSTETPYIFPSSAILLEILSLVLPNVFMWPFPVGHYKPNDLPEGFIVPKVLEEFPFYNASKSYIPKESHPLSDYPSLCAYIETNQSSLTRQPSSMYEDNMELVFLGTGSAIPGKYRNVSGTYMKIADIGIMMDIGEGSLGQLSRLCDLNELYDRILNLRVIFISHMHADHHIGAISFLKKRAELIRAGHKALNLTIIGPLPFYEWLRTWGKIEDLGSFHFLDSRPMLVAPVPFTIPFVGSFKTAFVRHSVFSTALVFESVFGWKLVYSGDCIPDLGESLICKNADLLIHEATFSDEEVDQASAKLHSTWSQAVNVARSLNVKNLILTHFTQKNPIAPMFDSLPKDISIFLAFDFSRFRWSSLTPEISQEFLKLHTLPAIWEMKEKF